MTAVDTGWINDEKPIELAAKHHQKHDFQVNKHRVKEAIGYESITCDSSIR